MTTTRAAKYLNASDLGKVITGTNLNGQRFGGRLTKIETIGTSAISITVRQGFYRDDHRLAHDTNVTITGTPTPERLDHRRPVTDQHQGAPAIRTLADQQPRKEQREQLARVARAVGNTEEQVQILLEHYDLIWGEEQQRTPPIHAVQAADANSVTPHFTIHEDGHIEQHVAVRPRRNGKSRPPAAWSDNHRPEYRPDYCPGCGADRLFDSCNCSTLREDIK